MTTEPSTSERGHLASKKFTAFVLALLVLTGITVLLIFKIDNLEKLPLYGGAFWLLLTVIITIGCVVLGYVVSQASLDKYLHSATTAVEVLSERVSEPPALATAETVVRGAQPELRKDVEAEG